MAHTVENNTSTVVTCVFPIYCYYRVDIVHLCVLLPGTNISYLDRYFLTFHCRELGCETYLGIEKQYFSIVLIVLLVPKVIYISVYPISHCEFYLFQHTATICRPTRAAPSGASVAALGDYSE